MKRILQMATLSLVTLAAASSYAQEPPAAPPPATTPAGVPAEQAPVASTALGGGMLIGGDLRLALPLGNFSDFAGVGFGVLGRFEYILTPQVNLTGRLGFTYFLPKSVSGIDVHYWTIPILVGAKFAVIPNLYVAGEIGLFNNHATVAVPGFFGGGTVSNSETDFGLTLGAGYRMGDLDFRASLEFLDLSNASDTMSLVVSAGYNFWKKFP